MSVHSIEVSEADGVRFLHFGSEWIQGAMRVRRPYDLELEYTRAMMACLLFCPAPENILIIGMGAGSLVKFALRHIPDAQITVVEIDSRVVAVAREQFRVPRKDERLVVAVADGFDYMRDSRNRFDLVLVDGFDADARPGALDSLAFYTAVRARLGCRVSEVAVASRTSSGRAHTVRLSGRELPAVELRQLLGYERLPSLLFDVHVEGGAAVFEGRGSGHGVGLCQYGARERARRGEKYAAILAHYYPGAEIRRMY